MSPGTDVGLSGRQPRAVQSALRVLEEVARAGAGVTGPEVAAGLGMPPATVYRLLNLLVGEEYLVRLPDLRGFALGRRLAALVEDAVPAQVPTAAREVVAALRERVRGCVTLIVYSPTALRVADADPDVPGPDPGLLARHLHASSAGKLLLAEQPQWRDVFPEQRLQRLTGRTITRPGLLDQHLDRVRSLGHGRAVGELEPGTACLGVPVRDGSGHLVAAITLAGPSPGAAGLEAHLPRLAEVARKLAPLLA